MANTWTMPRPQGRTMEHWQGWVLLSIIPFLTWVLLIGVERQCFVVVFFGLWTLTEQGLVAQLFVHARAFIVPCIRASVWCVSHLTLCLLRDLLQPLLDWFLGIFNDHSFALAKFAADDADDDAEDSHNGTDYDWDHHVGIFLFFARCVIICCNLFGINWVSLNFIISLFCWVRLFIFFFLFKYFKLRIYVDIT